MADNEVRHVHVFADKVQNEHERKLGQETDVGSPERTPAGEVQIPKGALYRIASAMKFDLDAKGGADHEAAIMEHLKKMAAEHMDMKSRLADMEAKHAELEAKRAKADVGRLVALKAIDADEKTVASVIKMHRTDPDMFETLYAKKLAGTDRASVRLAAVDNDTVQARLLVAEVARPQHRPQDMSHNVADDGSVEAIESPHARATKLMTDNKSLTFGAALTLASKQLRAESRNERAGAR